MIVMAIDHTRDLLHADAHNGVNPLDFSTTTPLLFITRWITHFCAPAFVFLAGTSIYFIETKKPLKQVSLFLLTRGLWLMLMELTLVRFAWTFNVNYGFFSFGVIWVIGLSMVCFSLLIYLPKAVSFIIGMLLVFGHNLLDRFQIVPTTFSGFMWSVLHIPHEFTIDESHSMEVLYVLMPWLGLMVLGYHLGSLYRKDYSKEKRKKILLASGLGIVLLFIVLRFGNIYGEMSHWHQQSSTMFTFFSFVNTSKYPPSLLFLLMTIGPAIMFLAISEKWRNAFTNALAVFGRVPFFYYVLHLLLIHAIAKVIFFTMGYSTIDLDPSAENFGNFPLGFGLPLWQVYVVWLFVILALYLPCRWYDRYKKTHNHWWLSYM
jgi:uncharacterized membrane protein